MDERTGGSAVRRRSLNGETGVGIGRVASPFRAALNISLTENPGKEYMTYSSIIACI
ncbi:hypothetical protein NJ7G_0441 [Natrinema sp. J7-2]|nr:hypothetical protein NJ7G_0441 [Natrinema sp. J7-2]